MHIFWTKDTKDKNSVFGRVSRETSCQISQTTLLKGWYFLRLKMIHELYSVSNIFFLESSFCIRRNTQI